MVLTDRFKFRANQTIQNARKKEAERLLMEKENWIRQVSRHNSKSSGRISIYLQEK